MDNKYLRTKGLVTHRANGKERNIAMNILTCAKVIFLLCLTLIPGPDLLAQEVKVSARIDSTNILIGDHIRLQLSATYDPQAYKVQFPSVVDTFNHFEVVEKGKMDTIAGREQNTVNQQIIITNYDSGAWKIPPLVFDVLPLQGGEPEVRYTDSFLVNVNTVAVDTAKPFKPIFGIRSAKMPLKQIILYAVGILLLTALLAFLIWYLIKTLREKNKKPAEKIPEIVLLPHEKALQALSALGEQALWMKGQEKAYHTELTDIMRTYLEEQFGIDCLEKTSSEIMQQIKRHKALSTSRQSFRTIFETADLVKFAKSHPTPEEHLHSLHLAKEMVQDSYKKVKPVQTTEGNLSSNSSSTS